MLNAWAVRGTRVRPGSRGTIRSMRPHLSTLATSALSCLVTLTATAAHAAIGDFEYLSPAPASSMLRPATSVVVRYGPPIDPITVAQGRLSVTGSVSGTHTGLLELSDDGTTLVFTPLVPFAPGDSVTAKLRSGIRTTAGAWLPDLTFGFRVSPDPPLAARRPFDPLVSELPPAVPAAAFTQETVAPNACPLPSGYIPVTVLSSSHPEPGARFLDPFSIAAGFGQSGSLVIVDELGNPLYWRNFPSQVPLDFKPRADGRLTWIGSFYAYVMDSSYAVIDSFTTGNGYPIDGHDVQFLPNGHVLLLALDDQRIRMDAVVAGGDPDAIVEGLVIQELDRARRVVFQWRSWDHIPITDCVSPVVDMTSSPVDYVHGNSIESDSDGNLILSSRHLDEITKIDRRTGAILWRMGPHALHNQFAFPNDARGFSHQHDARRQPGGTITLLDNGNYLSPQYSRALEYQVDERARTASLVWSYTPQPALFAGFMGGVQVHADNSRTLCWSGVFGSALRVTELHPDASVALTLGLPANTFSYRAYRAPWSTTLIAPDQSFVDFGAVAWRAGTTTRSILVRNRAARPVTIDCAPATHAAFSLATPLPLTLAPGAIATLAFAFRPDTIGAPSGRIYLRSTGANELVAAAIDVRAMVVRVVDVAAPQTPFAFAGVSPDPVRAAAVFAFDLPRAAHVVLEVFGVDGRRVATVVAGELGPGSHAARWRAHDLPGGVYFARLTAGHERATRRFVLVP